MQKKLSDTKDAVNEVPVDFIKKLLSKLKRIIGYTLKMMQLRLKRMKA